MKEIEIYIDGSCKGNPGPGGWAAVCEEDGKKKYRSGSEKHSTNNKMELTAAIGGLEALTVPCNVTFFTDSAYLITVWLTRHSRKNADLWSKFFELSEKGGHKVKFVKVKGHAGNKMNELADRLAKEACKEGV